MTWVAGICRAAPSQLLPAFKHRSRSRGRKSRLRGRVCFLPAAAAGKQYALPGPAHPSPSLQTPPNTPKHRHNGRDDEVRRGCQARGRQARGQGVLRRRAQVPRVAAHRQQVSAALCRAPVGHVRGVVTRCCFPSALIPRHDRGTNAFRLGHGIGVCQAPLGRATGMHCGPSNDRHPCRVLASLHLRIAPSVATPAGAAHTACMQQQQQRRGHGAASPAVAITQLKPGSRLAGRSLEPRGGISCIKHRTHRCVQSGPRSGHQRAECLLPLPLFAGCSRPSPTCPP